MLIRDNIIYNQGCHWLWNENLPFTEQLSVHS